VIGQVRLAARQPEQQPGVHRPEHHFTRAHAGREPRDVLEQPLDLRRREVGIEHQPGALADQLRLTVPGQLLAARRRAAVLPDERPMHRASGVALPGANGLALIRDAEGGRHDLRLRQRLPRGGDGRCEDLLRIVLDLPRRREVLRDLAVAAPQHPAVGCHDERRRAGGSLIDGKDGGHVCEGNAEFGMWNAECQWRVERFEKPPLQFRIPHFAFST